MSKLISPPSTWSERPCAGMNEGWRVKERSVGREGGGEVGAEAGDSRLLACVVFPLRDLYTNAVGINFWWTIGTASSPLALSSHPISSHSLYLSLSLSLARFLILTFFFLYPRMYCKLAFLYAALCFGAYISRLLAPWYLCQSSREGLRNWGWTLFSDPCLLLDPQQRFQCFQPEYSVFVTCFFSFMSFLEQQNVSKNAQYVFHRLDPW